MIDRQELMAQMKALREQRVVEAWAAILNDPNGRLVVYDILEQCAIYQTTFTGNATGNMMEGRRQIGLWMLSNRVQAHSPRAYPEMLMEAEMFADALEQQATLMMQEDNDHE